MQRITWILAVLIFFGSSIAQAADFISLKEGQRRISIDENISYIKDQTHELTFQELLTTPDQRWQKNERSQVNFGYSDASYWIKFSLHNQDALALDRILEIGYAVLDNIDIYLVRDGLYTDHYILGDKLPFYERLVQNRNFLIPMRLEVNEKVDVYLKLRTTSSVQAPMDLWNPIDFHQVDQSRVIFQGIYFGIALVMILYNLFVYLAVSEKTYLHYVAYISCMPLFLASLNGLSFQYLWPTATWWNDQSIVFFLNGVVVFGTFFSLRFLSLKREAHRWIYRSLHAVAWLAALLMVCSLLFTYQTMIRPTIYVAVTACIALLIAGIYRCIQGDVSARYFTVAWTAMLSGGIVLALNKFTLLPQNVITESATQIGSALEIILLSIALADRLNQEKRKAFNAQIEALEHEREARQAQEETLKIQKEANQMLEQRVNERTSELAELNAQLIELNAKDALTGLKNRGYFDEKFQHYYTTAYRLQKPLSLLIIDIDHFKQFNDNHGHLVGDECLVMVATAIKQVISHPEDITCRYGGEEFVVILPETDQHGAYQVAEKIRQKVAETPFQIAAEQLQVTVSVGTNSLVPVTSENRNQMFDQADEALYKAKNQGRNQVAGYQPKVMLHQV
ncbi:sensor domain-containing diguanylate cyclase [Litoribrevibacter albus]|uniref:diguanylate cyclase n=1 Tax=Litoribrevibacter albus TaxID=1473156 RepID=A0AA37W7E3_9GAMM|nr:7TM diverse intracellular signaling domain-containing protein [Litoribrevibacter albus]GLQ32530.1 deoxynucleoside kinase [Litoribrevibacter albus]